MTSYIQSEFCIHVTEVQKCTYCTFICVALEQYPYTSSCITSPLKMGSETSSDSFTWKAVYFDKQQWHMSFRNEISRNHHLEKKLPHWYILHSSIKKLMFGLYFCGFSLSHWCLQDFRVPSLLLALPFWKGTNRLQTNQRSEFCTSSSIGCSFKSKI